MMRKYRLMHAVSRSGFTHVEIILFDRAHSRTSAFLGCYVRDLAFILKHVPERRGAGVLGQSDSPNELVLIPHGASRSELLLRSALHHSGNVPAAAAIYTRTASQ